MVNLIKDYPVLAAQVYDPDGVVDLCHVGLHEDLMWQCSLGHRWEAKPGNRIYSSTGCHYCSNRKILAGFNDLATTHPEVAAEWSSLNTVSADAVGAGASQEYFWECPTFKHVWKSSPKTRVVMKTKCPVCSNRKILAGFNDLATTHPEIAAEWHPTKNEGLLPSQVSYGSKRKVWWLGADCGHEWEAVVKMRQTYGCSVCTGKQVQVGVNDFASAYPALVAEWHPVKNTLFPHQVSSGSHKKVWWKCEKGHEWRTGVKERAARGQGCRECYLARFVSKVEQEVYDYVASIVGEDNVKGTVWWLINGEVDMYVPSKKIAIEFNGVYWHSEQAGRDHKYHYDKWKACQEKGVQLIQVWEDDYARNPELVKRMLAYKLGVNVGRTVYARKTVVRELSQADMNTFLNEYHIQGATDGGIRVGLFEKNSQEATPVAVMLLKREPGSEGTVLNLLRYATAQSVPGGFTKLLTYVEKIYTPEKIVTFSDNTVSDGGLYENNGFVATKELKPDYMYVVRGERVHKFNYRLKRFRNDEALKFEEGLTERELAMLNNIPRVWDAGKVKWEKMV